MSGRSGRRKGVVYSSSSEEDAAGASSVPPGVDEAGPSTALRRGAKGRRPRAGVTKEDPDSIVSVVDPDHTFFGKEMRQVARRGFKLRCPGPEDRVNRPRPGEVGFYLPCVKTAGLRFPPPILLIVILHTLGLPLYMVTANSIANVLGFLVICGLCDVDVALRIFRYFFHTVQDTEGYYVIQARRNRKLVMGLENKVKNWKEQFAFLACPDGAAMPGPAGMRLNSSGMSWMNSDPWELLSPREEKVVEKLWGLPADRRKLMNLLSDELIDNFLWEKSKPV